MGGSLEAYFDKDTGKWVIPGEVCIYVYIDIYISFTYMYMDISTMHIYIQYKRIQTGAQKSSKLAVS